MPVMSIPYQVRRTGRRSKNISVRVRPDATVRVCAPSWASLKEIHGVVEMHAAWIEDQLEHVRAIAPRYEHGALHFYLGKRYPLAVVPTGGRAEITFTGTRLRVVTPRDEPRALKELLRRWYRAEVGTVIGRRLARLQLRLDWVRRSPNWKLRWMRGQWGSCATNGDITLNTQLAKAPLHLIDYVLVHELAHLKHHDHGRGFERLMDAHISDWRDRRRELNALGALILVD
jgi:predicted metal-dependent hydrolase